VNGKALTKKDLKPWGNAEKLVHQTLLKEMVKLLFPMGGNKENT